MVSSIYPGMRLRSYLEGLESLTLPRLLRSHYQEKSATELSRQLSTLVQEPYGFSKFLNKGLRYKAEDPVCVKGGRHLIKV